MDIFELVFATVIIELLEALLQYDTTLKSSLFKQYYYYLKSPFLFFGSQLGYVWLLFLSIFYGNLSWAIVFAVVLKSFDIFTKITLLEKLFIKPDSNYIAEIEPVLDMKIPFWVYLIGPMTYPYLVYLAFV
jgi:hypothetical protein